MPRLFSEAVWMRLGFWAIGVVVGAAVLLVVLPDPGEPPPDVPAPPPKRRAAPAPAPKPVAAATTPATPAIPEREKKARQSLDEIVALHSAQLAGRLAVPRPGLPPTHADKLFSARLKGARPIVYLDERQRTPFSARVTYDIDWYCNERLVGPQEIVASYDFKDGAWLVADAYRKVGNEHVHTPDEKAWLRNLFR